MDRITQHEDPRGADENESALKATAAEGAAGVSPSARQVRARLNGLPCLVSVTDDCALTGQVAVSPVAGARAPLPPKGRRAMLELVVSDVESAEADAVLDPIEITVAAANPRSGRFTARVMTLSEEQERVLCAASA